MICNNLLKEKKKISKINIIQYYFKPINYSLILEIISVSY